jgi:hypothetical protein
VIAGLIDAKGPTLLPRDFAQSAGDKVSSREPVRLGSLEGYRYSKLEPDGFSGALNVYVVPTNAGVATVACFAEKGGLTSFAPQCERAATSLKLSGAEAYGVEPTSDYADRVNGVVDDLDSQRSQGLGAMRSAKKAKGQARAAKAVASAYADAAASLREGRVSPAVASLNSKIAARLSAVGSAYRRLAKTARRGKRGPYRSAVAAIRRREGAAQAAIASLKTLGYDISG